MKLALLHRRLTVGMGLAALAAFAAGAGLLPEVVVAALGLGVALWRLPPPEWGGRVEQTVRVGALLLCAWAAYVAFVAVGDFMPQVLAMLLFLLVGEALRPLEARNDMRLYALSFALLIAATAYYPGLQFAAAFIAYVALATLALMTGHLRREAERFRVADVPVGRPFLTATAALSGVTVLMSAAVFVVFPRLPRQWNVHGRSSGEQVMAGFSDVVSLEDHGGRITANPEVAFRVEFAGNLPPDPSTLYWRGRSFDRFDGRRWSRMREAPLTALPRGRYAAVWGGPPRAYRVYGGPPGARVLFGLHPLVSVWPRSAIRPLLDLTGDVPYVGSDAPVYGAVSAAARPPEEVLRAAPQGPSPGEAYYLQLPRLSPRVRGLADSLTAGAGTRLERARAVERWLKEEFRYTLELPADAREAEIEHFLFQRRAGHCEYFSTAMVLLLRSAGVPARNVNGFLGGEWNEFGKYLAVTGNEAHSWVEVWFPEVGWVPFDPTPPGSRALATGVGGTWRWPAFLWLDGMQHRWYKWVIDYNLEKQLGVFRRVGSFFDRGGWDRPAAGRRWDGRTLLREVAPWLLGAAALFFLARVVRRRRPGPGGESRLYLALRRAYARAGYTGGDAPLEWVSGLRGAPGAEHAERLVRLYLRARFGGEEIGEAGRLDMAEALDGARGALRARN